VAKGTTKRVGRKTTTKAKARATKKYPTPQSRGRARMREMLAAGKPTTKREAKPFKYSDEGTVKSRAIPSTEKRCPGTSWTAEHGSKRCALELAHPGDHVSVTGETWKHMADARITPLPVVKGPQLELAREAPEVAAFLRNKPEARNTRTVGDRERITQSRDAGNTASRPSGSVSAASFFGAKNVGTAPPVLVGKRRRNGDVRAEGRIMPVLSFRIDSATLAALDRIAAARPWRPSRSTVIVEAIRQYAADNGQKSECPCCRTTYTPVPSKARAA
jgi:hypothetical protein